MGNCAVKQKNRKQVSEIAPFDNLTIKKPHATVHGDPENPGTNYLLFSLLYKPLTLTFTPSQSPTFTLCFETDDSAVSGTVETVLRFVDSKLPHPPLFREEPTASAAAVVQVVRMAELQHRSLMWHVERVVRWGEDLATRGGKVAVDPSLGTPRMEVSKLGKSYGKLLEVLLEHAQMEERVLFPILQANDPGVCKSVNEEHARDLPIMNGIREDIKSIGVLNSVSPTYQDALYSLSARLETLQDNCKDHFKEEERNLFPLMEAADFTQYRQRKVVEQCIDVMEATNSHLFDFFIEGLLPHEALEYLDLVMNCVSKERASSMLRLLIDK